MLPDFIFDRLIRLLAADERPTHALRTLRRETVVPAPLAATFAFFADAANLDRLTPPWLNFRIHSARPIEMREGAIIDYRISLYGIPIPWRTRIEVWEPGVRFVDRQLAGPYHWWRHEHRFEAHASGTRVVDVVEYAPRAAVLSRRFVTRDVERIFAFRQSALARILGA